MGQNEFSDEALFAWLVSVLGPGMGLIRGDTFSAIALDQVRHSWWIILLSSGLAGWLMGFLSWLIIASRDTISQIFFVWVITAAIGLGHLHHIVMGAIKVFAALFSGGLLDFADAANFFLWTSIGNIVGGAIFALVIRYSSLTKERTGS
jgi:formate-nitrite transporter family protein